MLCKTLLQKEDVVKLTEKCGLNSAGGSPVVTPLRTPEDLKSNILKAQAEAAGFKVKNKLHTTGEKGKEDRNDKYNKIIIPLCLYVNYSSRFALYNTS